MSHLDPQQQVFVCQQVRNWIFSRYAAFRAQPDCQLPALGAGGAYTDER